MMQPCVYSFLFTAIFYCVELGNIATIRKVELTHAEGTLEGLCNVNPNGVVISFGVSLVLAEAVVEKAIMANMPNWRLHQLNSKYHIS